MAVRWVRCGVALIALVMLLTSVGPAEVQSQAEDDLAGLRGQVGQLHTQGKYAEAIPIAERYVALARQKHGEEHTEFANAISWMGYILVAQGRSAEAEPLYRRSLRILERALGPDHLDIENYLRNLADLYQTQGRYGEAEPLYRRRLAILEKGLGSDAPDVGTSLNHLAFVCQSQGRYTEAEPLFKRAISLLEKALGLDAPEVGSTLNNLAVLYQTQSRYAEAEPLYRRSLTILEKALGPDHPEVGTLLNNLASLYKAQGRITEAEPLYKRDLAVTEKALGPDHPSLGLTLTNLAVLYQSQGRYAEAEPLYRRSLTILEKALGSDHPAVGHALLGLAELYSAQGRYVEGEPLIRRSLALWEKALGPDHPFVGASLNRLAVLYQSQGRYVEAEPLHRRSLVLREKALGPDHLDVDTSLNDLAALYFMQRDWGTAADLWRRSTRVIIRRARRGTDDVGQALTGKRKGEAEQLSSRFLRLVKVAHRLATEEPDQDVSLARDMFQTAQWAVASDAAASLAQMAARQAKGDNALARLVRERQDLVGEWQARDKLLIAAVSQAPDKRSSAAEAELRVRLSAIDARITEIDQHLKAEFPDYAALARPEPLSIEQVQGALHPEEALVLFLDTTEWNPLPEETFIWIVTKTEARWARSNLGTKALTERVAAVRCGLDATAWQADGANSCAKLLRIAPDKAPGDNHPLPFDLARAHELYQALFGQVADLIKDKHLLIVPSGPLTKLPFHVLVTVPSKSKIPRRLAEYRKAAWLGTRQPITVLPSVASLQALRQFAKTSRASKAYFGIGNPLLNGPDSRYAKRAQAARTKQQCPKTSSPRVALAVSRPRASFATLFRGGQADIEEVRRWTPLPETADELCEVGHRLGVLEGEILLGSRATEAALKDLSEKGRLADYAILHFATHGALTGQAQGSAEPGLILTPPVEGTSDVKALERDDGFLTASEIATLKLDADWVILSACNTAGASGETAEPLSGMARAFFYAGARALLVSHWEVGSYAAVKLTTRAFAELKADPNIGRAEALRRSMRELIEKGSLAEAHPSLWAPFVVVGEGAAAR